MITVLLKEDRNYLLFLRKDKGNGYYYPLGIYQGKYVLKADGLSENLDLATRKELELGDHGNIDHYKELYQAVKEYTEANVK